jgi:hypothetical protein
LRRVHDGDERCATGVRQLGREFLGTREGAAAALLPEVVGEDVDEADRPSHRALVERVERRHDADLDVDVRVQTMLGERNGAA